MSAAKPMQRRRVLDLQSRGRSQREIAEALNVSRRRVRQILAEGQPGDVLHERMLSLASLSQLVRHEAVLLEHIARDRRYLRATREEIESRRIDESAGLTLPTPGRSATIRPCSRRVPAQTTR